MRYEWIRSQRINHMNGIFNFDAWIHCFVVPVQTYFLTVLSTLFGIRTFNHSCTCVPPRYWYSSPNILHQASGSPSPSGALKERRIWERDCSKPPLQDSAEYPMLNFLASPYKLATGVFALEYKAIFFLVPVPYQNLPCLNLETENYSVRLKNAKKTRNHLLLRWL